MYLCISFCAFLVLSPCVRDFAVFFFLFFTVAMTGVDGVFFRFLAFLVGNEDIKRASMSTMRETSCLANHYEKTWGREGTENEKESKVKNQPIRFWSTEMKMSLAASSPARLLHLPHYSSLFLSCICIMFLYLSLSVAFFPLSCLFLSFFLFSFSASLFIPLCLSVSLSLTRCLSLFLSFALSFPSVPVGTYISGLQYCTWFWFPQTISLVLLLLACPLTVPPPFFHFLSFSLGTKCGSCF